MSAVKSILFRFAAGTVLATFAFFPVLCQAQGFTTASMPRSGTHRTPVAAASANAQPEIFGPGVLAVDSFGNQYVSGKDRVFKVDASGTPARLAGAEKEWRYSGDGGQASLARLNPRGVTIDSAGNLYIADSANNRIRRIAIATGVITTFAGNGIAGFSGDGGPASAAQLDGPTGVALDAAGNLFVADGIQDGHMRIRKVAAGTGIITTVAGNGTQGYSGDGGPAIAAQFSSLGGLATDAAGNLYIADNYNNRIRKVSAASGIITTVAGNGVAGHSGDGGPAVSAALNGPLDVAADTSGNLYIADSRNYRIRKVAADSGTITTLDEDHIGLYGDGRHGFPCAVAVDATGNLYVADSGISRIRKLQAGAASQPAGASDADDIPALQNPPPSSGLVINVTYGTGANLVPAAAQTAFNSIISTYESIFTGTNVTVNLDVNFGNTGLGESETFYSSFSYASWRTAMSNNATANSANTYNVAAAASLPVSDPLLGGSDHGSGNVDLNTANARGLGLSANVALDSTLTFSNTSNTFEYTGVPASNLYDFMDVATHELDEALGVNSSLTGLNDNSAIPSNTDFGGEDYFRYSAVATRSITTSPSAVAYFSYNGGTTNVAQFNQENNDGDRNDWVYADNTCPPQAPGPYIQDAIGCPDEAVAVGQAGSPEIIVLSSLGFNAATAGSTPQMITFNAPGNVTFGVAPFSISASSNSGLTVAFASNTLPVCTVSLTTVTIIAGGTCTITASQAGNSTYAAATPVMRSFTVNPEAQTITFNALGNVALGIAPFLISASSTSGLTVAFASNTLPVCTLSVATVTILTTGTCTITASQTGNASYSTATPVMRSFTVNPGSSPTWTPLNNQPTFYPDTALLLTNGVVLVHENCTGNWHKLTPDSSGSYINGTWSLAASMPAGYGPLYFASAVLPDGRVVVTGGEYNEADSCQNEVESNLGAVYDPVANSWTSLAAPGGWTTIGDSISIILPNGQFVLGHNSDTKMAALNASNLTWTALNDTGKADNWNGEEGWTLLQNGTFITVDTNDGTESEIYNPATNNWTLGGNTGPNLITGFEVGPAVLRPDGTIFATGATGNTAIYNTSNGTWSAGPSFPLVSGNQYAVADGPAALLPSGNVLVGTSPFTAPSSYNTPTQYFEFDGVHLNSVPLPPHASTDATYYTRMLPLPTGQVLFSDDYMAMDIYTPTGTPNAAWAPTISSVPGTLQTGQTYTITGTQFNGLSQASAYGDDVQNATNYPLVRITNNATGHVFYCRTHNHSTMGVATGATSVSTMFDVGASVETGASMLVVVANGIASSPTAVTISASGLTAQTITFGALPNVSFGTTPFALTATASSGLTVAFASTTMPVCTVSVATVTIVAAGTCSITATQPGNGTYAAATPVIQSFTVNPAAQTITFNAPGNVTFGVTPFALTASSTSGLTVAFASTTMPVCTVAGTMATIVSAGTCTITASQAGNTNYAAATPVMRSFTVNQANQTITFNALGNVAFGVTPFALTASSTSGLTVAFASTTMPVCTVSGTMATIVSAGTCTITASQAGNTNYAAAAPVMRSFTVTQANQTITFNALGNVTFGATPFAISATASSGLTVTFASTTMPVCTVSGTTVTIAGAGTCSITASQAGNTNYTAAAPVMQSFTVNQASQTITFSALGNVALGTPPFAISASASSGLAVGFASTTIAVCTVSGTMVTVLTAGTCSITASQPGNANYTAATLVVQSFGVGQTSQTISFSALGNVAFGVAAFPISASASSGLTVTFASNTIPVCTVSGTTVAIVAVGTCSITASQAGNATYAAATPVVQSFTVTQGTQTITFNALGNVAFGAAAFPISASASSGLAVTFASNTIPVCTVSGTTVTIVAVGACSITATQAGNATYAAAAPVVRGFTVNQATQTITFNAPGNVAFGTAPFAISAAASSGLAVSFASNSTPVCTVSGTTVTIVAIGTCSITASQPGNANYSAATPATQTFAVTLATQTIAFGSLGNVAFGTAPFAISATASSGLAVSFTSNTTPVCTVSVATVTIVAIGTCSITASQPGNATYSAATPVTQTFSIATVAQSITFAPLGSVAFGTAPLALSATASSGLPVSFASTTGSVCTVSGNTLTIVAAGTCSITATQPGNANVPAANPVIQSFTVVPAPQFISFGVLGNVSLGVAPFALSATASSGLTVVFASNTPAVCTVSGVTVTTVATGTCSIMATQPGNANYLSALPVTQNFTVASSGQNITFAPLANASYGAAPFLLTATASSGLPVSFASTTGAVCTVSGNTVSIVGAGTCSITATQPGNASFPAATPVIQSFTVNPESQSIGFASLGGVMLGTGPIPLTATATSGLTVSFMSITTAVCSVSGTILTIANAGTCTIVASQAGNTNYQAAAPVSNSFVVSPASQAIVFPAPSNQMLGVAPFTLNAVASSGLPVTFVSTTTSVCTVSGATVTLVSVGTCTIQAMQSGNANYLAAASVTQSFTVSPAVVKPSEVGVFRQNFAWLLDANGNRVYDGTGPGLDYFYFNFVPAQTGDIPVVGDWSGSGTTKIGIYRPSTGQWFLDYNGNGIFDAGDKTYSFGGIAGDKPVVGDWNGSGTSKIGIFRSGFFWLLDYNGDGTFDNGDQAFAFGGVAGDVPVAGDWTGDGKAKVGVVRVFFPGGTPAFWILDANNDHSIDAGDLVFAFGGITGDVPVAGDWNGTGFAKAGMFRSGFFWVVDNDGSAPNVLGGDQVVAFGYGGVAGDVPVVGKW